MLNQLTKDNIKELLLQAHNKYYFIEAVLTWYELNKLYKIMEG